MGAEVCPTRRAHSSRSDATFSRAVQGVAPTPVEGSYGAAHVTMVGAMALVPATLGLALAGHKYRRRRQQQAAAASAETRVGLDRGPEVLWPNNGLVSDQI